MSPPQARVGVSVGGTDTSGQPRFQALVDRMNLVMNFFEELRQVVPE